MTHLLNGNHIPFNIEQHRQSPTRSRYSGEKLVNRFTSPARHREAVDLGPMRRDTSGDIFSISLTAAAAYLIRYFMTHSTCCFPAPDAARWRDLLLHPLDELPVALHQALLGLDLATIFSCSPSAGGDSEPLQVCQIQVRDVAIDAVLPQLIVLP